MAMAPEWYFGIGTLAIGASMLWVTLKASPHRPSKSKVEVNSINVWPVFEDMPGEHHVGVEVINHGPVKIQVTAAGLLIKGHGQMIGGDNVPWQQKFPSWLEPGSNLVYWVNGDSIRRLANELGVSTKHFMAYARLADGRQINAKKGLTL